MTPKIFFQKSGSVTFVPLWCPNFMQKTKKTNEQSLRYLKTDTHTDTHTDKIRKKQQAVSKIFKDRQTDGLTDKGGYYGPHHWINPGPKCLPHPRLRVKRNFEIIRDRG